MGDRQLPRAEDGLAPDRRLSLRVVERPSAGEPVGALVFLHGYYGLGSEHLALLDELDPDRRFHGFLPNGPLELGEGRAHWVELNAPVRAAEQVAEVAAWLDTLPFPSSRIVLGGWSQGAAVAFVLALAAGRPRPAAVLVLGGSLPIHAVELDLRPPFPRVAVAHGANDDASPVAAARNARTVLELAGADVLYRETPVGHEIDQNWIPDLRALLADLPAGARG